MSSIPDFRVRKNSMSKRTFVFALGAVFLTLCVPAEAQQPVKIPRLGLLIGASPAAASARIEAFRQGLRELETCMMDV
jgi:hypothetical protein